MNSRNNKIKSINDSAYKYLFKNKRIFFQLIQGFVYEDFVKNIKIEDIDFFDKSFVSDEFLDRESDIIYKIKYNKTDIYIYILLEFQSTVNKSIPVRMFLYILELYDLIYKNSKKGKLPNVFPIMLYNGITDWTVPTNLKDLIDKNIPDKYIPNFEYYPIIEKDIPDEKLEMLHNLVSAVIYMEKQKSESQIAEAIDKVIEFVKNENIIDVRMFTIWINQMFKSKINENEIEKIQDMKEAKSMLTLLADKIEKKGVEKGKIEGELEKSQKTLIKQLSKKFGIDEFEISLIKDCRDIDKLDKALEEILFADSKDKILYLIK